MSEARKCDRCNELFEPAFGCVSIDVSVQGRKGTNHSWSDVDFCGTCSASLLDLISAALSGLCRPRAKTGRMKGAK